MKGEELLREYIELLAEDYGGYGLGEIGGGADWAGWNYGLGMGRGGGSGMGYEGEGGALLNIFVKPFTDVFQTAVGKTKELSIKTQTFMKVAKEALLSTFIPLVAGDYEEIFEEEKQDIEKLKQKYGPIYQANHDAFKHPDFVISAFLTAPEALLTYAAAKLSPGALLWFMDVLTGDQLRPALRKLKNTDHGSKLLGLMKQFAAGTAMNLNHEQNEARIIEARPPTVRDDIKNISNTIKSLFGDVSGSKKVQQVEKDAHAVVEKVLKSTMKLAAKISEADTVEELSKNLGLNNSVIQKFKSLPAQERQQAEAAFMRSVKTASAQIITNPLKSRVQNAQAVGIPASSYFVQAHLATIKKIERMLSM